MSQHTDAVDEPSLVSSLLASAVTRRGIEDSQDVLIGVLSEAGEAFTQIDSEAAFFAGSIEVTLHFSPFEWQMVYASLVSGYSHCTRECVEGLIAFRLGEQAEGELQELEARIRVLAHETTRMFARWVKTQWWGQRDECDRFVSDALREIFPGRRGGEIEQMAAAVLGDAKALAGLHIRVRATPEGAVYAHPG